MKCNWNKELECMNNHLCGPCKHRPADDEKPNGKNPPVEIEYHVDYGMVMPYCPSCGEMSYSEERCVFCGQKFIEKDDALKNETVYEGVDKNGKCLECGNDTFTLISHIDATEYFMNEYKCSKCGNYVAIKTLLVGERY